MLSEPTELLEPRDVPLGGLRAMHVRRTLPQRARPTVGAWCFLDEIGPERVDMRVLPHPHIGLQTVTWPLVGEVRHRDSLGSDVVLRPGELDLMTSGRGIAHSEFSLGDAPELHALQLWVALPAGVATGPPAFEQHRALPVVEDGGVRATLVVGSLAGATSPATVYSPLVGAELDLAPGARVVLDLEPAFEHAVLVVQGSVRVRGSVRVGAGGAAPTLVPGPLLHLGAGLRALELASETGGRCFLLGGEPLDEDLIMWWNFVGREHDEIVAARADWEGRDPARFGVVDGHDGARIPAPELPNVRLRPRRRRS